MTPGAFLPLSDDSDTRLLVHGFYWLANQSRVVRGLDPHKRIFRKRKSQIEGWFHRKKTKPLPPALPFKVLNLIIHHHHVMRPARISLTLSLHVSLSFIASGRSSRLHPVSSHSCCMYVRAGRPAFDWPYAGVHRGTSLTSSSLLLQQCPACLVRLASKLPRKWTDLRLISHIHYRQSTSYLLLKNPPFRKIPTLK